MNIEIDGHENSYKDANEAFLAGVDLKLYLKNS